MQMLKFGIRPHNWIADPTPFDDIIAWVVRAEALGFDSVHVGDRLLSRAPPVYESTMYEPITALTMFAAHTHRMQLSPLVFNVPFRHPIHTAKVFASLDLMSHGRAILGVGTGWSTHEFDALGVKRSQRGKLLEEGVQLIKRLWTENHVDFDGEVVQAKNISVEPKPVQTPHLPIWFGSFGPEVREFTPLVDRVLDRIGRLGDGWVPLAYSTAARQMVAPEQLGQAWERIERAMVAAGRDPRDCEIIISQWPYVLTNEAAQREECETAVQRWFAGTYEEAKRTYPIGTPEQIVDSLKEATRCLPRVDRFIFTPFNYSYEQMDRLVEDVMPLLRETFA
ncbi:MAG: putative F420-dependent oxidoreductase [Gammaproteobacteria bacterium]|jgi:probable F420-dependent oxidoreductase